MSLTNKEELRIYYSKAKNRIKAVYNCIISRCYKRDSTSYKRYGAKGITVCEEWLNNPQSFYDWALENGYRYIPNKKGRNTITIDRIDNAKGYSPENCRWVSYKMQGINREKTKLIEYKGKKQTLQDWCKELNLTYSLMYYRINYRNMTFEDAMMCPNILIREKTAKSNQTFIYIQKDGSYSVQIKRKYYGRSKNLQEAIKIRDKALKELGLLNDLKELQKLKEIKGE